MTQKFTMGFEYECRIESEKWADWDEKATGPVSDWFYRNQDSRAYIHEDGDGLEFSTHVFDSFEDCMEFADEFLQVITPHLHPEWGTDSGIHVHITHDAFTLDQIAMIVYMMNGEHGYEFSRMSGRQEGWGWLSNGRPNLRHLLCARAHLMGYSQFHDGIARERHTLRRTTDDWGGHTRLYLPRDGFLCTGGHPTYEQRMFWSSPLLLKPAIQQLHSFAVLANSGVIEEAIRYNNPYHVWTAWCNSLGQFPELNRLFHGSLDYGKDKACKY